MGDLITSCDQGSFSRALGAGARDTWFFGGYPDDEGIRLNGGRAGAAKAPLSIRQYLYKMTPHLRLKLPEHAPRDIGDLSLKTPLGERHEQARQVVHQVISSNAKWLSLGGGHDYGYADGAGFLDAFTDHRDQSLRPLILNFDAHLDVRPLDKGFHSGTPFRRLLELGIDFDFVQLGIQSQCNARAHAEYCRSKGVTILSLDEIYGLSSSPLSSSPLSSSPLGSISPTSGLNVSPLDNVSKVLSKFWTQRRPVFLSIDMDFFSNAYAPGCSQSWGTGFEPSTFFPILDLILRKFDVRAVGLYEVSPPLDFDDKTSKLAAQIAHYVLHL